MRTCGPSRAQGIGIVLIILAALAMIALTVTDCTSAKLIKQMGDPEMAKWLRQHSILMNTVVPKDVAGIKGQSEYSYFLHLPYDLKCKYRAMFWKIRDFDTEKVFKSREFYVSMRLRGMERSEMAYLILLCGEPDFIQLFLPSGENLGMGSVGENKLLGELYAQWYYSFQNRFVVYVFHYVNGSWREEGTSAEMASETAAFERRWMWLLGPNWNGWDEWRAVIGKSVGQ
jgi:hypothetical protein